MAASIADSSTEVPGIGEPCSRKICVIAFWIAVRTLVGAVEMPLMVKSTVFAVGAQT